MTFELSPDQVKDLPPAVATILQEFVATLVATRPLECVILFRSAAEGRLRSTSDVNLLVIASDWTLEQLDAARLPMRSGRAAAGLTVMFLKTTEVAAAVESFAVKFESRVAIAGALRHGLDNLAWARLFPKSTSSSSGNSDSGGSSCGSSSSGCGGGGGGCGGCGS